MFQESRFTKSAQIFIVPAVRVTNAICVGTHACFLCMFAPRQSLQKNQRFVRSLRIERYNARKDSIGGSRESLKPHQNYERRPRVLVVQKSLSLDYQTGKPINSGRRGWRPCGLKHSRPLSRAFSDGQNEHKTHTIPIQRGALNPTRDTLRVSLVSVDLCVEISTKM